MRALLFAATLSGCTAETLDIVVTIDGGACMPEDFARVSVLAVAVYGEQDGERCAIGRRCVYGVDGITDADDITAALRSADQPLVEAEVEGAETIEIVGREGPDCYDAEPLPGETLPDNPTCGANDFAEAEDGDVTVTMRCAPGCTRERVPLCL